MSPKWACALLPWRECSRAGFARQRGPEPCHNDNVTSPQQAAEKFYPRRGHFAENRIRVRDTRHSAGAMLACPRRVCYKFLTEFGPTTRAFHQFSCARNQLQAGVLRSRSGRKNRQPAVDLRPYGTKSEGQNGVSGDGDGPHAVLRLPAIGFRDGARVQDALSPIYSAGTGVLRGQPQADSERCGWRGVCRRFAGRTAGREFRNDGKPAGASERTQPEFRDNSLRADVEQA